MMNHSCTRIAEPSHAFVCQAMPLSAATFHYACVVVSNQLGRVWMTCLTGGLFVSSTLSWTSLLFLMFSPHTCTIQARSIVCARLIGWRACPDTDTCIDPDCSIETTAWTCMEEVNRGCSLYFLLSQSVWPHPAPIKT